MTARWVLCPARHPVHDRGCVRVKGHRGDHIIRSRPPGRAYFRWPNTGVPTKMPEDNTDMRGRGYRWVPANPESVEQPEENNDADKA